MADPFSITVSAIGIAAFGQQLVQAVRSIKQFCKDVKNAPEELQETLDEIAELGRIMERLGTEEAHPPGATADEDILNRSIQSCQRAGNRVFALAAELQSEMRQNKLRGALKTTMKEHELERMLLKLDRGKGDLRFAYELYKEARRAKEAEGLRQCIEEERVRQTDLMEQVLKKQEQILATGSYARDESNSTNAVGRRRRCGRFDFRREMHFRAPSWLCQYACDFLFERASGRWTVTLNTYRIIEDDCILEMCRTGDIVGIRYLLETRQLSIHDQFPQFFSWPEVSSLYSAAINSQQTELARFLLQCGVDDFWSPIVRSGYDGTYAKGLYFGTSLSDRDPLAYMRGHAQLIQEHNESEWEEMSVAIDAVAKDPSQWTAFERLLVLSGLVETSCHDLFWKILGPNDNTTDLFLVDKPWCGNSLPHIIAALWCHATELPTSRAVISRCLMERCQELLEIGVRCGADFHKKHRFDMHGTPFLRLLLQPSEGRSTASIQDWVSALSSAGADIVFYGEIEHRNFRAQRDLGLDDYWSLDTKDVIGFTFGPDPSDWVVYYEDGRYNDAAEFWDTIDHPEWAIPGAWSPETPEKGTSYRY